MITHKILSDGSALCAGVPYGHAACYTLVDSVVTCETCLKILSIQKNKCNTCIHKDEMGTLQPCMQCIHSNELYDNYQSSD